MHMFMCVNRWCVSWEAQRESKTHQLEENTCTGRSYYIIPKTVESEYTLKSRTSHKNAARYWWYCDSCERDVWLVWTSNLPNFTIWSQNLVYKGYFWFCTTLCELSSGTRRCVFGNKWYFLPNSSFLATELHIRTR